MVKERFENMVKTAYVQEISIECSGNIYMDMLTMLSQCEIICKSLYEAVKIADEINEKSGGQTIILWENLENSSSQGNAPREDMKEKSIITAA